jgi:hypothetical protein
MSADFTFETYAGLLEAGIDSGFDHLTVREYLDRETLPERFVVHRHDVDRKPDNARRIARIEAERDVRSTFYFRTIDKTFVPSLIREIASMGHEVGYHYEDLDRADGDVRAAHESFARELARLRDVVSVDTVCMHGNPLTPHDNREMWESERDFEDYGLLGEAYLSMDFTDVTYFSDTGRTWADGALKVKDHPVGDHEKYVEATSTADLIGLLTSGRVSRACLLSHPNRWAGSYPELVVEYAKDTAVNVAKHGLNLVS